MPGYFCTACKKLIIISRTVDPGTFKCEGCLNSGQERQERRTGQDRRGPYRRGGRRKDDC